MNKMQFFFPIIFVVMFLYNFSLVAQITEITGTLLDVDGNPSKYALVGVAPNDYSNAEKYSFCDDKGNYSVNLTRPGLQVLIFSIPGHSSIRIPILNVKDKKTTIEAKLATYKYKNNFDDLRIAGSFNGYNIRAGEKMIKQKDGTYKYQIKSRDKEIEYQLCGIEEGWRTVNAPESWSYRPDGSGDYQSVVKTVNGKATIIFDPKKLLIRDAEQKITFGGDLQEEKIFKIYKEHSDVMVDASKQRYSATSSSVKPENFQYDRGNYFNDLLARIDSEQDGLCKNALKLMYVSFAEMKPKDYSAEKALAFSNSIAKDDYVWDLIPMAYASQFVLNTEDKWAGIEDDFLKNSKCNTIKFVILSGRLVRARMSNDVEKLKELHALIKSEYKNIKEAQDLLVRYPAEFNIKTGAEIPDYKVKSMGDSKKIFSKKSMKGKIYLIDFWATWCMPCVGEMEFLHKAYEKYKKKGFEILSLSRDGNIQTVMEFRKGKWKMPWKHGFIGNEEGAKLAEKFEVIGIPKPILVDKKGKILALEGDLRGENLEKTLAKYIK